MSHMQVSFQNQVSYIFIYSTYYMPLLELGEADQVENFCGDSMISTDPITDRTGGMATVCELAAAV